MAVHGYWKGGALLGKDGFNCSLMSPAPFCRNAFGSFDDFTNPGKIVSTTAYAGWTVTATGVGEGTLVMADAAGGVLQLTPAAVENQGIQMQTDGELFLPATGNDIWFECRVRGNDVTQVDWFIGLCETDTSIIATAPTHIIGFWTHDGDANIDFQVATTAGGAAADTGQDLADATWVHLGFHVLSNTTVYPYVNGTAYTAVTTNIPATELALSFACLTGEGASNTLDIDWWRICQLR